jgi:hypothetical protein
MSFNKILTRVLLLSTVLALTAFSVSPAVSAKPKPLPELPFTKKMQEVLSNESLLLNLQKTCDIALVSVKLQNGGYIY